MKTSIKGLRQSFATSAFWLRSPSIHQVNINIGNLQPFSVMRTKLQTEIGNLYILTFLAKLKDTKLFCQNHKSLLKLNHSRFRCNNKQTVSELAFFTSARNFYHKTWVLVSSRKELHIYTYIKLINMHINV